MLRLSNDLLVIHLLLLVLVVPTANYNGEPTTSDLLLHQKKEYALQFSKFRVDFLTYNFLEIELSGYTGRSSLIIFSMAILFNQLVIWKM